MKNIVPKYQIMKRHINMYFQSTLYRKKSLGLKHRPFITIIIVFAQRAKIDNHRCRNPSSFHWCLFVVLEFSSNIKVCVIDKHFSDPGIFVRIFLIQVSNKFQPCCLIVQKIHIPHPKHSHNALLISTFSHIILHSNIFLFL